MQLLSVNVGQARAIVAKSGRSGIFKRATTERVRVTRDGLLGDTICDTENHGGPDQAVYLYGAPDYAWWSEQLGRTLAPGTFGENLTVSGLESATLQVGDRFRVGEVVLEVTAPRIPCVTLAVRMGDPAFVKRFRHAERPGVYCRVLHEGDVWAGAEVRLEPYTGATVGVLELFRDFFRPERDEKTLRRHLAAPIASRDRAAKEAALAALRERGDPHAP
ncbi:MOSC domain-containing protein [Truepera radiovictrix]|uniref:MOSC domain containing protein n=1 Tax=Truepera radiovictrix (strain DSM 17093 / CIP 108686 / LMG 22925 / RQ-24) TaxID=649638 RepID=D7CY30_TRURR|nr:MOSC domain-containing protein [Truepera radiovictrix]ADI13390.1 MOSC domain containing protein [Truepera radiovictrix DSM 17093]WMT58047.1 MOSC domain-containing protein [Truepera radiovictrix]